MGDSKEVRIVLVTCPTAEKGEEIAQQVVGESLAACVNIVPALTSIYRWEGKVERSQEVLLVMKTTKEALERLEQKVIELHPYDTPEFVALKSKHVNERYLKWLTESVA